MTWTASTLTIISIRTRQATASGKELDFPDDASWRRFGAGGKLSRDDWRRENVNTFIQRVYKSIKAGKALGEVRRQPVRHLAARRIRRRSKGSTPMRHSTRIRASGWRTAGWITLRRSSTGRSTRRTRASRCCCAGGRRKTPQGRILCPGLDSTKVGRARVARADGQPQEIVNQIRLTRTPAGRDRAIFIGT